MSDRKLQALGAAAARPQCRDANLLRQAATRLTSEDDPPPARVPLFRLTGPSIADDIDGALEGCGVR